MALRGVDDLSLAVAWGVAQALVPALLMNLCIVGFNQLCDVEIDKVNKPYLPLASGEFSPALGRALVVASGMASLALGAGQRRPTPRLAHAAPQVPLPARPRCCGHWA